MVLITAIHLGQAVLPHRDSLPLQIDIEDVAAINPELLQLLPLRPKGNLPLQENVAVPVSALHRIVAAVP